MYDQVGGGGMALLVDFAVDAERDMATRSGEGLIADTDLLGVNGSGQSQIKSAATRERLGNFASDWARKSRSGTRQWDAPASNRSSTTRRELDVLVPQPHKFWPAYAVLGPVGANLSHLFGQALGGRAVISKRGHQNVPYNDVAEALDDQPEQQHRGQTHGSKEISCRHGDDGEKNGLLEADRRFGVREGLGRFGISQVAAHERRSLQP